MICLDAFGTSLQFTATPRCFAPTALLLLSNLLNLSTGDHKVRASKKWEYRVALIHGGRSFAAPLLGTDMKLQSG